MGVLKYLKSYSKDIFIVILTMFINVLGVLYIPRITVNLLDIGVINGDIPYIIKQGIFMLFVALGSSAFMVISVKYSTYVATAFAADIREAIFKKVQNISITQFEKIGSSSMIIRSTDDINQIQNLTRMGLRMMLRAPLMFLGGIIMALTTNKKLATVFLVSLPITLLLLGVFGRRLMPLMTKLRKGIDSINKIFRQRLSGIRVIRAFNKEKYEEEIFSQSNRDYIELFEMAGSYQAVFIASLNLIMNLTLVGIVFFGSRMILNSEMLPGELLGFIQYANNIMMSFLMLSMIFIQIPRAQAAINRVDEVLNLEEDVNYQGTKILEDITCIEFKNVCFKYPGSDKYTLKNISFYAEKGEVVGIIGATGSGKTTIANLLVRFYDIDEGQILINKVDIKEYEIHSLRENIGYTEQKASLISGTVTTNVAMGERTKPLLDMENALDIAQADFILEGEGGVEQTVAQRGRNFSGGQKQRISIARAIFKDPSLYLIDDSFSALDYKTERQLRKELYEKSSESVMIVITQRATVAAESDFILLLDNGEMIGKGTHEELKESSQEYREILISQDFQEEGDVVV